MLAARSPVSFASSLARLSPAVLGLALLFAPRDEPPGGFAPDWRRGDERPSPSASPTPRFALAPRPAECDGGDGSGRGRPLAPASSPGDWVVTDDYPASALMRNRQGVSRFRLDVDEAGRPVACAITLPSGTAALDAAACGALMRRARFTPARDAMGCPIPARYSSSVKWQIPA